MYLHKTNGIAKKQGFTLIELLIVVAIIAILAAIAVPNFLEAQTRAKVSRVKSDMRTAQTALESYYVDNNAFPYHVLYFQAGTSQHNRGGINGFLGLSTPIAYLSSTILLDPFFPNIETDEFGDLVNIPNQADPFEVAKSINLVNIELMRSQNNIPAGDCKYVLVSYGPDNIRGPIPDDPGTTLSDYGRADVHATNYMIYAQYDPTNGTVSGGDILKWQQ